MSLKSKTDYFNLTGCGWEVASTTENKSCGTAEANGSDGFLVAVEAFGEKLAPTCEYVCIGTASTNNIVLGSVNTISGKTIALGSVSISTSAGNAPTMTASGQLIEDGGSAKCKCTIGSIDISSRYHAQTFGKFTVSGGQLTDSTITFEGSIGTAEVDGVIKSSDLVGGRITISGTIVGVNNSGTIATPTVSCSETGAVITQPVSESNPNGDFPTYSFSIMIPLKADAT